MKHAIHFSGGELVTITPQWREEIEFTRQMASRALPAARKFETFTTARMREISSARKLSRALFVYGRWVNAYFESNAHWGSYVAALRRQKNDRLCLPQHYLALARIADADRRLMEIAHSPLVLRSQKSLSDVKSATGYCLGVAAGACREITCALRTLLGDAPTAGDAL